jgi:hypothetical protein
MNNDEIRIKRNIMIIAGCFFFLALLSFKFIVELLGLILFICVILIGLAYTIEAIIQMLTKK